jgi:hypothetical protein
MTPHSSVANTRKPLLAKVVVGVAVTLYATACFLPATDIGSFDGGALSDGPVRVQPSLGWEHLVFGWLDFPGSLPAWSANFFLAAGLLALLRSQFQRAIALGALAALLGLMTTTSYKNEGRYIGFYLWELSHVTLALGGIMCWLLGPKQRGG